MTPLESRRPNPTAAHQSDCALLERIAGRDAGAVGELTIGTAAAVRLILRIVRDRREAEEFCKRFSSGVEPGGTYNPGLGLRRMAGRHRAKSGDRSPPGKQRPQTRDRVGAHRRESNENPETDALVASSSRAIRQASRLFRASSVSDRGGIFPRFTIPSLPTAQAAARTVKTYSHRPPGASRTVGTIGVEQ